MLLHNFIQLLYRTFWDFCHRHRRTVADRHSCFRLSQMAQLTKDEPWSKQIRRDIYWGISRWQRFMLLEGKCSFIALCWFHPSGKPLGWLTLSALHCKQSIYLSTSHCFNLFLSHPFLIFFSTVYSSCSCSVNKHTSHTCHSVLQMCLYSEEDEVSVMWMFNELCQCIRWDHGNRGLSCMHSEKSISVFTDVYIQLIWLLLLLLSDL